MNNAKLRMFTNTMRTHVERNDHVGAYILGCKVFAPDLDLHRQSLEHIRVIMSLEGRQPATLSDYIHDKYEVLLAHARAHLTEDQYELFYGAL